MALRTPQAIRFSLEIPELKKTISYRALKVGEQKKLLTVLELKDAAAIINTIVDIIDGITLGELDLSKTPMHLIDFIFLHSFIKSSGARSKAEYTCGGTIEVDEEVELEEGKKEIVTKTVPCGSKHELLLNLENAQIKYPEGYQASKLVKIDETMSIKLKMPDFASFKKLDLDKDVIGISDQYIFSGIEYILDGDNMSVPGADFSFDEMTTWLNELPSTALDEITAFFEGVPVLALNVDVTCPKCGRKDGFELQGLDDFFL
ncbi:baseplate hub protein [Xanthomonas phage BUDD]|nr:baseplate hub protein [Xanthomonas phage BUDD]